MVSDAFFELEQPFDRLSEGMRTSVLAEVVIRCPGHHVCRTAILKQTFITDAFLEESKSTFTILDGLVLHGSQHLWITVTEGSHIFQHDWVHVKSFHRVIEACSGIGAVSTCLPFCGASPACFIDANEKFAEWLQHKDIAPVIHGDLSHPDTIKAVADVIQGQPTPINGGIACQPFSSLGDRREQHDPRSDSLPGLLKMGFYLRSPVLILECTKEAASR